MLQEEIALVKFCRDPAIAVSSFVFVADGRDLRSSASDGSRKWHGAVERLREEYSENVFASASELPASFVLASLVFQNQGLQVF